MKVRFDDDEFELPQFAVDGLEEFLAGVCQAGALSDPELADAWTWGRAYISDLSRSESGVRFVYGGDEDMPDDGLGRYGVVPASLEGGGE